METKEKKENITEETQEIQETPKKHSLLKKIIILIIIILIILFCYMRFWIHKFIIIHEYPIFAESLPSTFNGLKIVEFSDIHFGRTTNEKEIEKIVEQINLTNSDIVIFSGDLFDNSITLSDKNIDFLKNTLSKINAKLKKYAIKGDSDYLDLETYQSIMESCGFQVLENQSELIFYEGTIPIQIGGISTIQEQTPDLEATFKTDMDNVAYKILIAHEPTIINNLGNTKVDLILSGHSLGGLIDIPYVGSILKKENTEEYQKGFYYQEDTTLFVSSGIGTENYSIRFNNSPAIEFFRFYNYK